MKSTIHENESNIKNVVSKTAISLKKTVQIILVIAVIISSALVAKNIVKNVKHEYSMLPAGSGKACFYDMMQ